MKKEKKELTIAVNIRMTKTTKENIRNMSKDDLGQENISGWITKNANDEWKKRNK
tara:strand:- start:3 stop:167 length:165 start_codon:yes stop_codon:yes gene_type:complete